jgi:hypothetical protein
MNDSEAPVLSDQLEQLDQQDNILKMLTDSGH